MTSSPALLPENRLAHETSPYLLQHKHNPVDWWPWGPPALAEAKGARKPILLSVGYAACHWCHVMAHESFEDAATAAVMNELFVNIKVDREERPDIDQIYMSALHLLGERGGWPLTMFLTRAGMRSGEARYFGAVNLTLERICQGGIYDHLGGGFSRYSVDERWLTPHFEKMLYDNAQLLELLALAYHRSGNALFRTRAQETVVWLAREMTTEQGAFCASLDADSEGQEGKFYVWSRDEIVRILGTDEADFFARHYDVTAEGNFEGHNILNRLARVPASADDETRLAALRERLLAARAARVRPGLDDKVLADWNGLMIAALVNAGVLLGEAAWLDMAARAFKFIATDMSRGERLGHSWRAGKLLFPGLASDHAAMIRAALALHEATVEAGYLDRALAWPGALDRHYANPDTGGYFLTADDAEGLVVRPNASADEATPNPNAVAAQNLIRLAIQSGQDKWRVQADRLFDGLLPLASENVFMHLALLNAVDLRLRAADIVIAGSGPGADNLAAAALKVPFLDRIVLRARSAAALPASHPAQAKIAAAGEAAAFVCIGEICSLPVAEPAQLADATK